MVTADPGAPSPAEAVFAWGSARVLERSLGAVHSAVRLRINESTTPNEAVIIPAAAFRLLMKILNEMASRNTEQPAFAF